MCGVEWVLHSRHDFSPPHVRMYECGFRCNMWRCATHVLLISEWKNNPGKLLCKWAVCLVEWTLVCGMTWTGPMSVFRCIVYSILQYTSIVWVYLDATCRLISRWEWKNTSRKTCAGVIFDWPCMCVSCVCRVSSYLWGWNNTPGRNVMILDWPPCVFGLRHVLTLGVEECPREKRNNAGLNMCLSFACGKIRQGTM